ncbi:hypothetical protein ACIQ2D_07375 [Lysinibacillus sp. NPDC097287]|uniref:hypothetical protein n=1 Tax=Lysinibacillus sp. NPDC097287 TaxID=3364144 RepID=UPI00382826F7
MKKTNFIFSAMLIFILLVSSGCTKPAKQTKLDDTIATISPNQDSEYAKTFEDLHLGILFNFDFRLPEADQRWVTIWVESYKDGEKQPQPLAELSYGRSPKQVEEGKLGFGIINPNTDAPLLFLYAPGITQAPKIIENNNSTYVTSGWHYAIGDEKVELKLGETKILAAFRQSSKSSMRTYGFLEEATVEKMVKEDNSVLLLKIKIDES